MVDVVKYFLGSFCIAIAVVKWLQLRRRKVANAAGVYTVACFLMFGAGAIVIAPTTQRFLGASEPFPFFTRWVGNGLIVGAGFCIFSILTYTVEDPSRARCQIMRHAVIAASVTAAMGIFLLVGNEQLEIAFVGAYGKRPLFAAYLLVFSAYVSCAFIAFISLIRRYTAAAPDKPLRVGLYTMMAGAISGLLWAAWKTAVMIVNFVLPTPVGVEPVVTAALSSASTALICFGAVIPGIARFAHDRSDRIRTVRRHRALEPLWRQMHAAIPGIKLSPADDDADEFSVYRRVIEIQDANLALRPHCHPDVPRWVSEAAERYGMTGDQIEVVTEASIIAGAIEAHSAGVRYSVDLSSTYRPSTGPASFDTERDWLIRVSRAFVRDPLVAHVRWRVRREVGAA